MKFIKIKKKQKPEVLKEKKEMSPKTARIVFLVLIAFLLISAPLGFLMGKSANVKASSMKEKITALEDKMSGNEEDDLNTFLSSRFMEEFIKIYMNKSNNEEEFKARQDKLNQFMIDSLPKEDFKKVIQNLVDFKLYNFEKQGSSYIAEYYVHYKIEYPTEKERTVKKKVGKKEVEVKEKYEEKKTGEKSVLLNIPFVQENGKFKVTGLPYYSELNDLKMGEVKSLVTDERDFKKASEKETEKISDFLQEFYGVYVSGDLKQATYMMESPKVLNGDFEISNSEPEVYKDNDEFVVYDTISLRDKDLENEHKEQVVIRITNKEGNYYIKKFEHEFGGIK